MKIPIIYGIGIGVVLALVNSLFIDVIGIENDFVRLYSGISPFIILPIGLFIGMRKMKLEVYKNELNYGQAIYAGIVISAFIALFLATYNFVYFQFLNPDYAEEFIRVIKPLMIADKVPTAEIEKFETIQREGFLPINQIKATFVYILLAGVVFTVVFGSILRTKDTFTQITKQ